MKTPDKALFCDRVTRVAIHELGHTMGLPHCSESKTCIMQDAASSVKTVDRSTSLCAGCRNLLNR
jgi:archaemetzincin